MNFYTDIMLKIISMPKNINIKGKSVSPAVLFSPALCESLLFWQASSISMKLHDSVLLDTKVAADSDLVSGSKLVSFNDGFNLGEKGDGVGLASGLMLLSAAGDQIISPARKHANFDYSPIILGFREVITKNYNKGDILKPDDFELNTFFYDNIVRPNRKAEEPSLKVNQRMAL